MNHPPSTHWTNSHFWIQPPEGFDQSTQGCTNESFAKIETKFNCKLPSILKDLYHQQNGGYIYPHRFSLANDKVYGFVNDSKLSKLEEFINLKEYLRTFLDESEIQELIGSIAPNQTDDRVGHPLERIIVISTFWGHSVLCLDYTWIQNEQLGNEPRVRIFEDSGASIEEFASIDSFNLFIESLTYGGDNFENDVTYLGIKTHEDHNNLTKLIEGTENSDATASTDQYPLYLLEGVRASLTSNQYDSGTWQFPNSECQLILCLDCESRDTDSILKLVAKIQLRFKRVGIKSEILLLPYYKNSTQPSQTLSPSTQVTTVKREPLPEHRYCVRWPRNWNRIEDLIMKLSLQLSTNPSVFFKVHLAKLPERVDLAHVVDTNLENYKKIWKLLWRRKNNRSPFEIELVLLDQKMGALASRQYKAFMINNNDLLIVTASAPIDEFEKYEKLFFRMIDSITPIQAEQKSR